MIKIHDFPEHIIKVYDSNNRFIGECKTDIQFQDVRYQIIINKLDGYYYTFNRENYKIKHFMNSDGSIEPFGSQHEYHMRNVDFSYGIIKAVKNEYMGEYKQEYNELLKKYEAK